jgi:hypothetical protein
MTKSTKLMTRMTKIIRSCQTIAQLRTAKRFCSLAIRQMYQNIPIQWQRHTFKLVVYLLIDKDIHIRAQEIIGGAKK